MPNYKGKEYNYTKKGAKKFLEKKYIDTVNKKYTTENGKKMYNIAVLHDQINKSKNKNLSKKQKDKLMKMEKRGLI
tara:strand:+ start:14 stop:241 length:228 start_codon:yes stop_codon:yes gene_type:complete